MTPRQVHDAYDLMQRIRLLDSTLANGNNAEMILIVRTTKGSVEIEIPESAWRPLLAQQIGKARELLDDLGVEWP